jgi:hypothetical protein
VNQEISCFKTLAPVGGRIDSKVGEKAILSGNTREHPGIISFSSSSPDRFMRRINKDSRVSVERCAHVLPFTNFGHDAFHHFKVRSETVFPVSIKMLERFSGRVQALEILGSDRTRY